MSLVLLLILFLLIENGLIVNIPSQCGSFLFNKSKTFYSSWQPDTVYSENPTSNPRNQMQSGAPTSCSVHSPVSHPQVAVLMMSSTPPHLTPPPFQLAAYKSQQIHPSSHRCLPCLCPYGSSAAYQSAEWVPCSQGLYLIKEKKRKKWRCSTVSRTCRGSRKVAEPLCTSKILNQRLIHLIWGLLNVRQRQK